MRWKMKHFNDKTNKTSILLGLRPWKKWRKILYIFNENCAKPNVTSHHSMDIPCYLLNQTLRTYKKFGNEKPRFALNLLLMTNFVLKKVYHWFHARGNKDNFGYFSSYNVNGCDLMHIYVPDGKNEYSNYNDCIFPLKLLRTIK